jgi:hypothetical protein
MGAAAENLREGCRMLETVLQGRCGSQSDMPGASPVFMLASVPTPQVPVLSGGSKADGTAGEHTPWSGAWHYHHHEQRELSPGYPNK